MAKPAKVHRKVLYDPLLSVCDSNEYYDRVCTINEHVLPKDVINYCFIIITFHKVPASADCLYDGYASVKSHKTISLCLHQQQPFISILS